MTLCYLHINRENSRLKNYLSGNRGSSSNNQCNLNNSPNEESVNPYYKAINESMNMAKSTRTSPQVPYIYVLLKK